jgi:hypothetical protein
MWTLGRRHLQLSSLTLLVPAYFALVANFKVYSIMLLATVFTSQVWHGCGYFRTLDMCVANITGVYQLTLFVTQGFYAPTALAIGYSVFIFYYIRSPSLSLHATIHLISSVGATVYVIHQIQFKN